MYCEFVVKHISMCNFPFKLAAIDFQKLVVFFFRAIFGGLHLGTNQEVNT